VFGLISGDSAGKHKLGHEGAAAGFKHVAVSPECSHHYHAWWTEHIETHQLLACACACASMFS